KSETAKLAAPKQPSVSAQVSVAEETITIKNSDTKDWPALNIWLNPSGAFRRGYEASIKPLKVGEDASYRLRDFTKNDGERFDPDKFRVKEVWIGGHGFGYSMYAF